MEPFVRIAARALDVVGAGDAADEDLDAHFLGGGLGQLVLLPGLPFEDGGRTELGDDPAAGLVRGGGGGGHVGCSVISESLLL